MGADGAEDLLAEFVDDLWVLGKFMEEEGEGAGGGVAAGEEDGDDLVADDFAVASGVGEGVKEGLVLRVFETRWVEGEALRDDWLDEVVHYFEAFPEGFAVEEAVEGADAGDLVLGRMQSVGGMILERRG